MTDRTNMLQLALEDSDEEDRPSSALQGARPTSAADRFQSASVTRGFFTSQLDEELEYVNVPVRALPRQASKKQEEGARIKMVHEVEHEEEEEKEEEQGQGRNGVRGPEDSNSSKQQEPPSAEASQSESHALEGEIVNAPIFSHHMLEIALSDSSELDSSTEGREDQIPQQQQQNEDGHEESYQLNQSAPSKLQISTLLEGVEDIKSFLKQFSLQPIAFGKCLNSTILRNSSGLNNFWPEFQVMVDNGERVLLHAKKMMGSTTSNYYITTEPGIESISHPSFIAKMRGNFSNSIYHVFDGGVNPEKASKVNKARSLKATIKFKSQVKTMEPRSFEVFILAEGVAYEQLEGYIPLKEIGLDNLSLMKENKNKIIQLVNRRPVYSEALKGFILNFGGRVQQPSIKNFIMENADGDKREVLMMGKNSEDLYRLDVSFPMPPYLALCVCLANFDSKFFSD